MVINDYENGGEIKNKAEEMVANFRNQFEEAYHWIKTEINRLEVKNPFNYPSHYLKLFREEIRLKDKNTK